jgi:uncharacterized protein (UPF0335 family)
VSAADQLRLFVERIERLDEEISGIQQDRRDVFSEAKSQGFDGTTIRALIKRRKMESRDRIEADALLLTYESALGMHESDHEVEIPQFSEDALDQAVRMVAEQVEGMTQGPLAVALRAGLTLILEEREDIREIQARIGTHRKYLRGQGLDSTRVMDVVRWIERCEKHGREKMLAADATYRLYRATAEAGDATTADLARDAELLAKFAGVVAKTPAQSKKNAAASTLLDARRFAGK